MLEAGGTTIARIRWSLSPGANGRYISTSHTEPAGMFALFSTETRIERSEWAFAGDWLQPLAYHYERTGKKARSIDITFDWDKNVAQHDSKGAAWRLPVPPGTLDKFNYLFALMRDLMRGERRVEYTVADGGHRLEHYVLAGIGRGADRDRTRNVRHQRRPARTHGQQAGDDPVVREGARLPPRERSSTSSVTGRS